MIWFQNFFINRIFNSNDSFRLQLSTTVLSCSSLLFVRNLKATQTPLNQSQHTSTRQSQPIFTANKL